MLRKFGPLRHSCALLFLAVFSISIAAQDSEREKEEKDAGKNAAPGMLKISGTVRCGKPDPSYSIDVPDRSGHALEIAQRKCAWTEPMEVLAAKTKTGVWDTFTEHMESSLHTHSFEVDTLDDGEKLTMQTMGQVSKEKGPVEFRGQWNFMRGTGKFKGIRGGGTFEGKLDADDVFTFKFEGIYDPASMPESPRNESPKR